MKYIPHDYARCQQDSCEMKDSCARYLQAIEDQQDESGRWFCYSVFDGWPCDHYIAAKKVKKLFAPESGEK